MKFWDKAELHRVWEHRQQKVPVRKLSTSVDNFMRKVVIPRKKKLARLAQAWQELLPEEILRHTSLESFRAGKLKIYVDSGPHLAELNLMLREGLMERMREQCPAVSLHRIDLVRGTWYRKDQEGNQIAVYQ